jgi:hypothetical protein
MAIHGVVAPARWSDLDEDQSGALRSFLLDLNAILDAASVPDGYYERVMRGLAAAYYAALSTCNWHFFITLLANALQDLDDAGLTPRPRAASAYWRLRSMVRENADLLPPEMLGIA